MRYSEFRESVNSIILEYDRNITANRLGPAILAAFKKEDSPAIQQYLRNIRNREHEDAIINFILEKLESADPTKNKQYSQWIAQTYSKGNYRLEDVVSRIASALDKFFKLNQKRKIPSPNNDINRYKSFQDFETFVASLPDVEEKTQDKGHAKEYYRDESMRVIIPEDQTAACYYGQGTRWCTAAQKNNFFSEYAKEGPLYIIIPTQPNEPGEKYQLHFESRQYMDEKDYPVDLSWLVTRFPSFKKAFAEQIQKYNLIEAKYSREQIDQAYTKFRQRFRTEMFNAIKENADSIVATFNKNADEAGIKTNKGLVAMLLKNELLDPTELVNDLIRRSRTYNWKDLEINKFSIIEDTLREWIFETEIYDEVLSRFVNDVGEFNAPDLRESYNRIYDAVLDTLLEHLNNIFNETFSKSIENEILSLSKSQ